MEISVGTLFVDNLGYKFLHAPNESCQVHVGWCPGGDPPRLHPGQCNRTHIISGGAQLDLGLGRKPLNNITHHPHSGTVDTLQLYDADHYHTAE